MCNPGTYGQQCNFTCPESCAGSIDCDNVNGTCLHGCKIGYTGASCAECKSSVNISLEKLNH